MKDRREASRRPGALARVRYLSLLVPALGACGLSPTAPVDEVPDEPVEPTYVYSVEVETRYIDIVGSCDVDIFGDHVSGEFQYHIMLSGPGGSRSPQASSGYNSVSGSHYQRNSGTNIDFRNRTYGWDNLPTPGGIEISFRLAEWDGVSKDSRMRDRSATLDVPYALGEHTRRLTLGATSACRGSLYYDVTWTRREVAP